MPPPTAWRVDRTDGFKAAYAALTRKNPRLQVALDMMIERIGRDPLSGDPKTGVLHGLRRIHVMDHWTITWELIPAIVNRRLLPKLREVWFIDVAHHE